jgi:ribosomal protein S18 acetylase RimI-like enzyme
MAHEISIRAAEPGDIPAVRALLVETWHHTYDALIGVEMVTEITNSWHSLDNLALQLALPDTSFLVADDDGAIVGHAFADAQRPPVLVISRLYVLPARQRRGIGKRLLDAAVAHYPACEIARLEVEAENAKGLSFYRREGFRVVNEAVMEGINHLTMEKRLRPNE